jgi:hypothetical protein
MLEQKVCPQCIETLDLNKFKKSKRKDKIYYSKVCQRCHNKKMSSYRNEYYKKKRAEIPGYGKEYLEKYRVSDKGKAKIKNYSLVNRDKCIDTNKTWYKNNKNHKREYSKEWIKNNPEKYKILYTKRNKKRQDDPLLNLSMRIRCAIKKSFRKTFLPKRKRTFEYLGYSNMDLFIHLKEFLDKPCIICSTIIVVMNNSNIDHIIPLCIATSENDIVKLNQLSNLRLICKACNAAKISDDLKMKEEYNVRMGTQSSSN